jgi:hypothetical protein
VLPHLGILILLLQAPMLETRVGEITVLAPPQLSDLAIGLAESAERPRDWPGLGRAAPGPFRLVLVRDSAALDAVSRGRAPGWGAGVAIPERRIIILRADQDDPQRTLRHELAHFALHEAVHVRVPLWFDEGYASWASGELDRLEGLRLNLALASGTTPDLRELDGMLRGSALSAGVAYALAATAVTELARRHPAGTLTPLLGRLRQGEAFDSAVLATTGLTLPQFEIAWRRHLRNQYNIIAWLFAGGLWAAVALALGGLLWYRRRADQPRRAALDEGWVVEEEPE